MNEVSRQGRAPCARDLVNNIPNMDEALSTVHLIRSISQPNRALSPEVSDQTRSTPLRQRRQYVGPVQARGTVVAIELILQQ